jgi:hypothetical protein
VIHERNAADQQFRQRVERAHQMSFNETLLGGLRLFDEECERLRLDLQAQFPSETPEQIQQRIRAHYEAIEAAEPNPWTNLSPEEAAKFL